MAFVFLASPDLGHDNSNGRRSRLIRPKRLYLTPEYQAPLEFNESPSDLSLYNDYQETPNFYVSDEEENIYSNNNYDCDQNLNQVKKVKNFTDAIKMAIDDQDTNGPFSKCVNEESVPVRDSELNEGSGPPLTNDINILIENHKRNACKILIRTGNWGLSHPSRKDLWQTIIKSQKTKTENTHSVEDYWTKVKEIYGSTDLPPHDSMPLPSFVDKDTVNTYHLNEDGVGACERIVQVLAAMDPNLEYCPFIYPITALLLHYMNEEEAFTCIDHMKNSKSVEFFLKKKLLSQSIPKALQVLAKRHVSNSFSMLSKYKIPQERIDCGFDNWAIWITKHLKFPHLVRVVDCYLNEGLKVFYRAALASFHLCMKTVAKDFAVGTALTTKGISPSLEIFYENLNVAPQQFIRYLFKIKKFQSKNIRQTISMHGSKIRDSQLGVTTIPGEIPDESPFQSMTPDEANKFSQAATLPELISLWRCLPDRFQLHLPKLIFTTQEDGSSLSTLYNKTQYYEPMILIIKSDKGCVFGAYVSQHLGKRNEIDEYDHKQHFFGTGETFVFSLRPQFKVYKWVGIQLQKENPDLTNIERSCQMFIHADGDEIIIGGGGEGAALVIDAELSAGKTNTCKTFNNEPLVDGKHFGITVLEAFALEQ